MNTAVLITLIICGTLLGIVLLSVVANAIAAANAKKTQDKIMHRIFKEDE